MANSIDSARLSPPGSPGSSDEALLTDQFGHSQALRLLRVIIATSDDKVFIRWAQDEMALAQKEFAELTAQIAKAKAEQEEAMRRLETVTHR
jgi:hypothetical protein